MELTIITSRHSHESATSLGEALDCTVYNSYQNKFYRGDTIHTKKYNMGCSIPSVFGMINKPEQVAKCVDKRETFKQLQEVGASIVPWTTDRCQAQAWLEEDHCIVNRATTTGKANAGLTYSYHGLDYQPDTPLADDAVMWTRYVNSKRELRAYVFKGLPPLVFEKVDNGQGEWVFKPISCPVKLNTQLKKAQKAFDGLVFSAYDIMQAKTGDFYILENNSAPSLLAHESILPALVEVIQNEIQAG